MVTEIHNCTATSSLDSFRLPFRGRRASVINRFNWIFQSGPALPEGMTLHNGLHVFSLS
jgi:hypothetical protein